LMKGTARVGGKALDLRAVTMPLLAVSAEKDLIAPPEGVDAIRTLVSHAEIVRLPGGHVGIVAGRSAIALWQRTVTFLAKTPGAAGKPGTLIDA
jgi:polyhydroxyalkanoate synthase subunit PhaC